MTGAAFGIGRIHWNWLGALVVLLTALPLVSETNTPTLLAVWALFALSLALMWGFAGILSFGHAAYFGLGAYTYAIASFNIRQATKLGAKPRGISSTTRMRIAPRTSELSTVV